MTELKPCPFCGGEFKIRVCDDEGNNRIDDYEFDAYSGLNYAIEHTVGDNPNCPIAKYEGEHIGVYLYDDRDEAVEALNRRAENDT